MELELIHLEAGARTSATPILFVHGAWHGAWCWEEHFMPYFAEQGFDCFALSLRGHGGSDCDKRLRFVGVDDYVEDLQSVVSRIGEDPVLIGHSMGGLVVQRYLEQHVAPAAVLLASVPPRGILGFVGRTARRHPLVFLRFIITQNPYAAVSTPELTREQFFSDAIPRDRLERYFSLIGNESMRVAAEMMALRFPRPGRVRGTPVLVLGAADDRVFTTDEVEATGKAYGCEAHVIDHMAHDMMLEEGWRAVADHIAGWLAETESSKR